MVVNLVRGCLALALFVAPVADAQANPAASVSTPDADQMALALKVVAIILPRDRLDATGKRLADAISHSMLAQMRREVTSSDLGLIAIVDDYREKVPVAVRETIMPLMPNLTATMARVYAREFTHEELVQILAFGQTSAGAKYLSRASDALQDPDMQAFFAQLMATSQDHQAPVLVEFHTRLNSYMAAHPELAKKPAP